MADGAPVEGPRSLLADSRVRIVTPLMLDSMTKRIAGWTRKGWKTVDAELAVAAAAATAVA